MRKNNDEAVVVQCAFFSPTSQKLLKSENVSDARKSMQKFSFFPNDFYYHQILKRKFNVIRSPLPFFYSLRFSISFVPFCHFILKHSETF